MSDLLQLALLIAILLPAGKLVASLFSRFGIPAIIGELMVGIVAGPGGFNLLQHGPFRTGQASGTFMLLAQIGGLVLMFIAGFETDIERMREAGVTAFLVALSGVIWPFALGAGAAHSAWSLLDRGTLRGRRADSHQRVHLRKNAHGRRSHGFHRGYRHSRRRCHRRRHGALCPGIPHRLSRHRRRRVFWRSCRVVAVLSDNISLSPPSTRCYCR